MVRERLRVSQTPLLGYRSGGAGAFVLNGRTVVAQVWLAAVAFVPLRR